MYVYRYRDVDGAPRIGIGDAPGDTFYGAAAVRPDVFGSLSAWLAMPDPISAARDALAAAQSSAPPIALGDVALLAPIDDHQEVWAAGVTYERSKTARMEESQAAGGGDVYDRVYAAERPELFFKANGWRVVGPHQPIRVRADSAWNVPEPELTLVISSRGRVVGATIGNDVSSRSIEGENPLYLPQSKVYDGGGALGPRIRLLLSHGFDLAELGIDLRIDRAGAAVFEGETTTARMRRTPDELAGWLFRELSFPGGAFLMTGTGLVPPNDFTLAAGDVVTMSIGGIGTLVNAVKE